MRRAQSLLEYILMIVILLAALLSIQVYVGRANQGRIKQAVDQGSESKLFSPEASHLQYTITKNSTETATENRDGSSSSSLSNENTGTNIKDDFSSAVPAGGGVY